MSTNAIINDINVKLVNFYLGVRDHYNEVVSQLADLQRIYEHNRDAFNALKLQNPTEHVEDANEDLYYRIRNMYNDLIPHEYLDADVKKSQWFYDEVKKYSEMYTLKNKEA